MQTSDKNRIELIDELVGLITGSLAFRSNREIAGILEAMKLGETMAVNGLRSANNSVMLCIHPHATREETVAALRELTTRVDEQWEQLSAPMSEGATTWPEQSLPN